MNLAPMRFKHLNLFFIYPFAVPSLDVLGRWQKLLENHPQDRPTPRRLEYLPQYIKLHSEEIRLKGKGVTCEIKSSDEIVNRIGRRMAPHHATITPEIILKKNGGACCVFQLQISPAGGVFEIAAALNFTLLEDYSSIINLTDADVEGPVFKMEGSKELFELFDVNTKNALSLLLGGETGGQLPFRDLFAEGEFQHPYVMTEACLAEGTPFDFLCDSPDDLAQQANKEERAKNWRDIESLLIRTYVPSGQGADEIDKTYLHHTTEMNHNGVANLYPFRHLFTNIHYRSCLAVHGEYSTPLLESYGSWYINQLKESVITARIQWFLLLLLNARIDQLLGTTASEAAHLMMGELRGDENQKLHALLVDVVSLRTSASLALNDPVSYGHAAGSFSQLFKRTVNLFRIDKLEDSLQSKLKALDRMYDDLRELYRLTLMGDTR